MTQKKSVAQVEAETQDEIAEIMSEIESLQTEMAEAPQAPPQARTSSRLSAVPAAADEPEVGLEDFRGTGDEPSLEETLGALTPDEKQQESTGQSLLDLPIAGDMDEAEAAEGGAPKQERTMDSQDGCLSMTLSGQMTLKLKYEFEGQEVTIGFSDGALKVELSDGTEFKIPVSRRDHSRAA
jgi:hypothetical protein